MGENVLDRVFSAPEEDVETFMELLEQNQVLVNKNAPTMESIARSAAEDRPDQISYPKLVEQVSGLIKIQHGPHDDDYVWHMAPYVPSKKIINFKVTANRVAYAIASVMQNHLPPKITAKVWLPYADWDIQEHTFKAMGLNADPLFQKMHIDKINADLFRTLNSLV